MCGIIGYVGSQAATGILMSGLRKLEYRGYDSAGIAVIEDSGDLKLLKREGKVDGLAQAVSRAQFTGSVGIGHTRWATHGPPCDINAHPHLDCYGDVVVIHNGIVENHLEIKGRLVRDGHKFASGTDSEVIPHLVEEALKCGIGLIEAMRQTIAQISGAHAIVALDRRRPDRLVVARVGNAGGVVIGYGEGESFVASDLSALLPHTRKVVFLEDREIAELESGCRRYFDVHGRTMEKQAVDLPYEPMLAAKGNFEHYMLKEIMEQPDSVLSTIRGRVRLDPAELELEGVHISGRELNGIERVLLVGMGTSLHAAMVGRHYMERIAGLPAEVDNASEFRYRDPIIGPETLVVSVGQSGETVDTLAAMELAKNRSSVQVTICNVVGSQASRMADGVVYTRCGLEIGVCSTKTFTSSIVALYLLSCYLGQARGVIRRERIADLLGPLVQMPHLMGQVTKQAPTYERLSCSFVKNDHFLFLGRGVQYAVAMEGALKLKEVSYVHAEGYPAGEMKHGPIALIDRETPVVAIAVHDALYEKMMSNVEQVRARGGTVIAIATEGNEGIQDKADYVISVPECSPWLAPVLTSIPLQFLAYYMAMQRGCDVDQPRNLAKTVTVE